MSMNLSCHAVMDGEPSTAEMDLIQTPTEVTYALLSCGDTLSIAKAYLMWVRDQFAPDYYPDVYECEQRRLMCVISNPESFVFSGE